ncbi:PREDICTED: RAB6-interacting golgin [Nanorana parkeri]|uniref:RAB6-interacting golgin n=1 Tax=Nanorana parkeri TaxID=125878 RepID=UPI0008546E27|nr:PREDICTED: RAB6-interacting golgin [Nanorana parkeri]
MRGQSGHQNRTDMAGWAGFSEDELRRLKQQRDLPHSQKKASFPSEAFLSPPQPSSKKSSQEQTQGKKNLQSQSQKINMKDQGKGTCSDRVESKPKMAQSVASKSSSTKLQKPPETSKTEDKNNKSEPQQFNLEEPDEQLLKLEMALSKKTQAEALKLKNIQRQLQALDDLVSTDIGILRSRIEQACIEFSHARKRYDRAESEFVAAKLDLHKKTQIKEQLTEHLCTIIQQNELRKAKRLEELMQQLEMETDDEAMELEIEVDRMLQCQEAEARKLSLASAAEKHQNSSNIQETCTVEKDQKSSEIQEICNDEKDKTRCKSEIKESNPSPTEKEPTAISKDLTHLPHELES